MNLLGQRVLDAAKGSLPGAWKTALWLVKLTLPISLGMSVLQYVGVVEWISVQLTPLFALMGLKGEASLIFLSATFGNIYAAIAVMFTVGVDYRSAIILGAMALICHNLIIETAIQRKAGASALWMPVLRVGVSLLCGLMLNAILPATLTGDLQMTGEKVAGATTWGELLVGWGTTVIPLMVKMVVIILSLNVLQGMLREFRILDIIAWPLRPLMKIFGLPISTSFLWIICNVIGLAYGGAAIIDEVSRGSATPRDARLLNTHVAISHSLLEDTSLFLAIGVPLFWLLVPRLALAICAVWIQRAGRALLVRRGVAKTAGA